MTVPLITLFSAPKPFTDPHIAMIQRNAIRSWACLLDVNVLLIGDEQGLAQAAKELRVKHLPDVRRNADGTPLISSMFDLARKNSDSELLCIINTDILLLADFVDAAVICRSRFKRDLPYVLLSRRWDLDVTQHIDFSPGWESRLYERVAKQSQLHKPAGSDFFLFPRSCYQDVPEFTIGRAGWDNWMIYKARKEKWPVVDGTPSMTVIHQNHDYRHMPGGKSHHTSPEADENIRLAGGVAAIRYTVLDSTVCLENGELKRPRLSYLRFMRGVELSLRKVFFFLPEDMIENVARPKRWKKRIQRIFHKVARRFEE